VKSRFLNSTFLAAALLAASSEANASEVFDASTFRPASGGDGLLGVEGARVPNVHDQVLDVKLWGVGEHSPLAVGQENVYNRVRALLAVQFKLKDGFALAVQIPYVVHQFGSLAGGFGQTGSPATGLGDMRVTARFGLLQQNRNDFNLAFQASFTLPTADPATVAGYLFPQGEALLSASRSWGEDSGAHVEVIANALIGSHSTVTVNKTTVGGTYLGARVGAASYFGEELLRRVFAEVDTRTFTNAFGATAGTPLEARIGLTLCFGRFVSFDLGGGVRNVPALGSPDWHIAAGLGYSPTTCHTTTPPLPGPSDEEIAAKKAADAAAAKKAAEEAAVIKAAEEKAAAEKAAAEKAAADKAAAEKAAAEAVKQAAAEAARKAEEEAARKDTDGDGVPDRTDNCPSEPGPASNFGCPLAKKQKVVVREGKIDILEKVQFGVGKANILPASFPLLDQVAGVLKGHPEILKLEVQGHTDNVGPADKNLKLSHGRAEAVVAYLVKKGVAVQTLAPKGYGEEQPIADNRTAAGRSQNRRVEFVITAR
jgi:outer membrane protein OmpA-like peptidoglycan-associated protein